MNQRQELEITVSYNSLIWSALQKFHYLMRAFQKPLVWLPEQPWEQLRQGSRPDSKKHIQESGKIPDLSLEIFQGSLVKNLSTGQIRESGEP